MLKKVGSLIIISILFTLIFMTTSCKDKSVNYTGLVTNNMQYANDKYLITVPSSQSSINLNDYFTIDNEHAKLEVSKDSNFDNKLNHENIEINYGDNNLYIRITDKDKHKSTFEIFVYRKHLYTVTFNTNGGTECEPQKIEEGKLAFAPVSLKIGYDLSWDYDFSKPITSDITINAIWTPKVDDNPVTKITVKFDQKYTDKNGNPFEFIEVVFGENYTLPIPVRENYTFIGWYSNEFGNISNSGIWNFDKEIDITLSAVWEANEFGKIIYVLNGGVNSSKNPSSYTPETANMILENPTREGYIFQGWFTDSEFSENSRITKIPAENSGNITIYAKWKLENSFSITYDPNGGQNIRESQIVIFGNEYQLTIPERLGYEFKGWYYGEILIENTGIWEIKEDITLVAKWEIIEYTIEFDYNGGEYDGIYKGTYNVLSDTFSINFIPIREGYIFLGWVESGIDGFNEEIVIYKGSIGNRKFVAKWFQKTADNGIVYDYINGYAVVVGYDREYYIKNTSKTLTIPETYCDILVTTIGNNAFNVTNGLSFDGFKLTIPKSITRIGTNAFNGCKGLEVYLPTGMSNEDKETWAKKVMVESGNSDVVDVILGLRPAIGFSKWQ